MNCGVCHQAYDTSNNKPFRVCTRKHTVCSSCLPRVKEEGRCPFCLDEHTILNDQVTFDTEVYQLLLKEKDRKDKEAK